MSVWAHVGAVQLSTVCVHWLWLRKSALMKGPGRGKGFFPEPPRRYYWLLLPWARIYGGKEDQHPQKAFL